MTQLQVADLHSKQVQALHRNFTVTWGLHGGHCKEVIWDQVVVVKQGSLRVLFRVM